MKLPEKAPDWQTRLKKRAEEILALQLDPNFQELQRKTDLNYYYWDKVRSQPVIKKFNKDDVWASIRLRRATNSRPTPVLDVKGLPFTYWLTDSLQKELHLIDLAAKGSLQKFNPEEDKSASMRFIVSSLMEEAITSSQIEGAVASIKEAKRMLFSKRAPKNKSELMIYNNYQTMKTLKELCRQELTLELILELHCLLTHGTLESIEEEGRFRTALDKVNVVTSYGEILFVPPEASEIKQRLNALIRFANEANDQPFMHPVVKAIILHFWMAYIHPFTDGNGRMARTLFYWFLLKQDYWLFEYTSISKTILKRTTRYANAYLYSEHDGNDLTYFIHFHLEVIKDAVEELVQHVEQERKKAQLLKLNLLQYPDLNMRQARIVQYLQTNPHAVLSIKMHQNLNGLAYQTARTDLLELENKGWLKRVKKGKTFQFVVA